MCFLETRKIPFAGFRSHAFPHRFVAGENTAVRFRLLLTKGASVLDLDGCIKLAVLHLCKWRISPGRVRKHQARFDVTISTWIRLWHEELADEKMRRTAGSRGCVLQRTEMQ